MFFGASGSIAGGQMYARRQPSAPAGRTPRMWKIAASYRRIDGRRKSSTVWFGVEKSM